MRKTEKEILSELDEDLVAFIAETKKFDLADSQNGMGGDNIDGPDGAPLHLIILRAGFDTMARHFAEGRYANTPSKQLEVSDVLIGEVACRLYASSAQPRARVLYLHGGGFVLGSLESHDAICADMAARTGLTVISADYRLAPEHPQPAAFEDCLSVYQAMAADSDIPILLAGDSAGAYLAAQLGLHVKNETHPASGLMLIYPALGYDIETTSMVEMADAPMLTTEAMAFYLESYAGDVQPEQHQPLPPLMEEDISGLPPVYISSARYDPLASDAAIFAALLEQADVPVFYQEEPKLVHAHLRARHTVEAAKSAFDWICSGLVDLADRALQK